MTMPDNSPSDTELQTVLETLADCECRKILETLERPASAQAVAEHCDLPQTSTYRKLNKLSEAGLIREGTELRTDGNHVTTYERSVTGVMVMLDADNGVELELATTTQRADERLAQFWSRISEEL